MTLRRTDAESGKIFDSSIADANSRQSAKIDVNGKQLAVTPSTTKIVPQPLSMVENQHEQEEEDINFNAYTGAPRQDYLGSAVDPRVQSQLNAIGPDEHWQAGHGSGDRGGHGSSSALKANAGNSPPGPLRLSEKEKSKILSENPKKLEPYKRGLFQWLESNVAKRDRGNDIGQSHAGPDRKGDLAYRPTSLVNPSTAYTKPGDNQVKADQLGSSRGRLAGGLGAIAVIGGVIAAVALAPVTFGGSLAVAGVVMGTALAAGGAGVGLNTLFSKGDRPQAAHLQHALQSLEADGVRLTSDQRRNLTTVTDHQWRELLHISRSDVSDKSARQLMRKELVMRVARDGYAEARAIKRANINIVQHSPDQRAAARQSYENAKHSLFDSSIIADAFANIPKWQASGHIPNAELPDFATGLEELDSVTASDVMKLVQPPDNVTLTDRQLEHLRSATMFALISGDPDGQLDNLAFARSVRSQLVQQIKSYHVESEKLRAVADAQHDEDCAELSGRVADIATRISQGQDYRSLIDGNLTALVDRVRFKDHPYANMAVRELKELIADADANSDLLEADPRHLSSSQREEQMAKVDALQAKAQRIDSLLNFAISAERLTRIKNNESDDEQFRKDLAFLMEPPGRGGPSRLDATKRQLTEIYRWGPLKFFDSGGPGREPTWQRDSSVFDHQPSMDSKQDRPGGNLPGRQETNTDASLKSFQVMTGDKHKRDGAAPGLISSFATAETLWQREKATGRNIAMDKWKNALEPIADRVDHAATQRGLITNPQKILSKKVERWDYVGQIVDEEKMHAVARDRLGRIGQMAKIGGCWDGKRKKWRRQLKSFIGQEEAKRYQQMRPEESQRIQAQLFVDAARLLLKFDQNYAEAEPPLIRMSADTRQALQNIVRALQDPEFKTRPGDYSTAGAALNKVMEWTHGYINQSLPFEA